MQVELLTSTENALQTAFTAIRTCYSAQNQMEVWNEDYLKYKENNNDHIRLVNQIVSHGHTSTLEHISFTFAIMGVSRSLLAQLTRHRLASYSVQSQRYVKQSHGSKHGGFDYVIPPEIENNKAMKSLFEGEMRKIQEAYNVLVRNGIKAQDARFVLPNAATTNITMTMNLRAVLEFYSKRNKNTHAQWEIAELAEKIREIVVETEPWTENLFVGAKGE